MPLERPGKDVSVHQVPQGSTLCTMVPVHERLGRNHDMRDTLDAHRRAHGDSREGASHGYHPHRGGRYLRPSADTSSTPPSCHGIDHQPASQNTPGKRTPDYGLRIISLLAKPVERIMMTSLSITFHCSWPIKHEHGWNTFRPTDIKVGWT